MPTGYEVGYYNDVHDIKDDVHQIQGSLALIAVSLHRLTEALEFIAVHEYRYAPSDAVLNLRPRLPR